jgi:phage gp46-like protein
MEQVTRWLSDDGDYVVGPLGACVEDPTIRTRALVRLRTRRGQYWGNPKLGSRLHELRSARDAEAQVLAMAKEALQPLLSTGELKSVELGPSGVYQDVATGSLFCQLLLTVDEETIIALSALPIGV